MIKRIFAAILLLCLFVSVAWAQSAATVFGWPPADGSISTVKLSELDYVPFDADAEPPAYAEGRLFWDKDNGCPAFYPDMAGPVMQVGQEFWVRVKNAGVATMTNGSVVCLNEPGAGIDPVAVLANASSIDTSKLIGVVTADISPDSSGYATVFGLVRNLNTVGFTPGARIFLAAGSPGTFTETAPAAPNYSVVVGYVMKAHATTGSIYVRPWINGALDRAQFASTLNAATGTAAAPAYSFASDPNTGVYSPAADNLAVSVAGAEALRVNSAGEVLIATTTDAGDYKLQVNGSTYFKSTTTTPLIIESSGATSRINFRDSTGSSFNIGTSGAANGDFLIFDSRASKPGLLIASGTGNATFGSSSSQGDRDKLQVVGRAYISDETLVATSTDAGDYKLQVNGNAYVNGYAYSSVPNTNTGGTYAGSFINNSGQNTSQHGLYVSVVNNGGNLVNMVASGTTRFRILNNGVVTLLVNQVYADNAAAISGGLSAGNLYRTSDGTLKIVY